MTPIILNKKKYVLVEQKEFEKIQVKAAAKNSPAKKLSLSQGKKRTYKLIDAWAK